ncbi:DUF4422 domain-containing protein [Campylobacter coli]|uniref:DUF4422 domain-containing protein n=1 Tax=Campylobacter coli TaxID=195 RepID=UPI0009A9257F|nr:DUF4422 domain-containing protein [Campylobacter coli]
MNNNQNKISLEDISNANSNGGSANSSNLTTQNPSIKILIGYHKPAVLFKDEILTPIHLGRALATQASKDGEMSKEDFEWMCENMIGDDTGDNISYLNRYFAEFSGLYWAWKNYSRLSNPDYIGFMHYRRHFIFDEKLQKPNKVFWNFFPCYEFIDDDFIASTKINNFNYFDYDLIVSKLYDIQKRGFHDIKDYFALNTKYSQSVDELEKILMERYEFQIYRKEIKDFFKQDKYYFCNMFVMKKDVFFEYCNFIFKALFALYEKREKHLQSLELSHIEKRELAYLGEFLSTIFINHCINLGKKIKTLDIGFVENTDILENLTPRQKSKNALCFYVNNENINYIGVSLKALENNLNVDIILVYAKLDKENQLKLKIMGKKFRCLIYNADFVCFNIKNKHKYFENLSQQDLFALVLPKIFKNFQKIILLTEESLAVQNIQNIFSIETNKPLSLVPNLHLLSTLSEPWIYQNLKNKLPDLNEIKTFYHTNFILYDIRQLQNLDLIDVYMKNAEKEGLEYVNYFLRKKISPFSYIFNFAFKEIINKLPINFNLEQFVYNNSMLVPIALLKELESAEKQSIFLSFNHFKPWNSPHCPKADIWWQYARQTPFYEEILFKNIKDFTFKNLPSSYTNSIQAKPYGAVEKIKTHLSYKLGNEILSAKENKLKVMVLPFTLIFISLKHKISNSIYKLMLNSNPNLKSLPLSHYSDYHEALKIQNYLSYKLGNLLVKHPFTFVFRVSRVYREWKKGK